MKKLRPSGGYRDTVSFQTTTLIYDATVWFCEKFLDSRSRTVDQMVQAARSGRQNIAEGSRAAATSSQTELRLVNVARASLEELLLDYEDYLRQQGQRQWAKDDPDAHAVREVGRNQHRTDQTDQTDRTDPFPCCAGLLHAIIGRTSSGSSAGVTQHSDQSSAMVLVQRIALDLPGSGTCR